MTICRKSCVNAGFGILLLVSVLLMLYISGFLPFKPDWQEEKVVEEILLPSIEKLHELSHAQLALLYHKYINQVQVLCRRIVRIGNIRDGGWEICEDAEFRPTNPCLVYSFGVNNDFSFDDHMADRYNCEVHSFDPSMTYVAEGKRRQKQWFYQTGLADRTQTFANGWKVATLKDLLKRQAHLETKIDVLKIDIEKYEWTSLIQIFESGGLPHVRQLLLELHVAIVGEPEKLEYIQGLGVLKKLYDHGFRIFYTHRNLWCNFQSILLPGFKETGCHEVSFLYIPPRETLASK